MTWVWTPRRHDEKRGAATTENRPTIAAHAGATTREIPTVAAHAGATTKGTTNSRHACRRDDQGNDQRPPCTPARRPGETNGRHACWHDDQEKPTVTTHAGAMTRGMTRGTTNGRRACRRDNQGRPTVAAHTGATTRGDQRSPRTPARRPRETRGAVHIHDPCLTFSSRKGCPTAMHASMTARTVAEANLPPLPTTGAPHCI